MEEKLREKQTEQEQHNNKQVDLNENMAHLEEKLKEKDEKIAAIEKER